MTVTNNCSGSTIIYAKITASRLGRNLITTIASAVVQVLIIFLVALIVTSVVGIA